MNFNGRLAGLSIAALAACAAFAQTPSPPATPATTSAPASTSGAAPRHACTKPGDYPGNLGSEYQRKAWQKDYVAYTDCLKKFIGEQKTIAEPHVNAYNAAVEEYNQAVAVFNEQIEKARAK